MAKPKNAAEELKEVRRRLREIGRWHARNAAVDEWYWPTETEEETKLLARLEKLEAK